MSIATPRPIPIPVREGIRFKGVGFTYPANQAPALQDIEFELPAGKITAIVGENGSGKTSLIKLLCRLYDPGEGRITLDGVAIRDFDPPAYRRLFSVIFQDYARYAETVSENIRYGDIMAPVGDPRIAHAADLGGATRFIKDLPKGLDTPLTRLFDNARAEQDLGFIRLAPAPWEGIEGISIDYAVMEKTEDLAVLPYGGAWSDLGDWQAVWREGGADEAGTLTHGPATAIGCRDTLLRAESPDQQLVGLGLNGLVVVAMPDAVLVADKSRAQDVRLAVEALKAAGVAQAEELPRDYRPWGWYESLALGGRFQVKRIVVNPGAALSLQSHHHRAEHWIVVEGTARVTVDDDVQLITENQSVYIPLGAVHRMENPGKLPLTLIEVQTGSYLGEDDIIRYEDVYARGQGARG